MSPLRPLALAVVALALGCALPPSERGDPAPAPPAKEAPAASEPKPTLRPRVDAVEHDGLLERARADIARAEERLASLDPERLGEDETHRLEMTRGLLDEARRAVEADDALRAASLAEKAAIVAEDLSAE